MPYLRIDMCLAVSYLNRPNHAVCVQAEQALNSVDHETLRLGELKGLVEAKTVAETGADVLAHVTIESVQAHFALFVLHLSLATRGVWAVDTFERTGC